MLAKSQSTVEIAEGTLHVSKPTYSSSKKSVRAVVTFTPNTSLLDVSDNLTTGRNEFRGFFSLFWISIFIFTVQTFVTSYERHGYPLSLAFASLFSRHALTLAISDAVLVASTGLSVLFAKAISKGWIRYDYTGVIIHHSFQALMLGIAITWTFNRQWPWVQSGFLTLHSLTMIMKVHSYCAINGYLQSVDYKAKETQKELEELTISVSGSYEAAVSEAEKNMPVELKRSLTTSTMNSSNFGTPEPERIDGIEPSLSVADASLLRNRLTTSNTFRAAMVQPVMEAERELGIHVPEHPLVHHPDERIVALAHRLHECEAELTGTGATKTRWPANITFTNFAVYQLIPTLVYELEFPRTRRIRLFYVLEKTVATFGTFALLYTFTEHSIMPLIPAANSQQPFWRSLLDLSLPFMISYLLLFYIIFECICNGFAELSMFADRRFYDDWWNSTSMDEFSRKWNRPVHTFLLRHVYSSTMSTYKLSKHSATFLTFLLSALVHELVMAIVTKKIRMYLFACQMFQIPLIAVGRIPAIRRNKILGNVVFWVSLYAGFPLLCVAYCAY